MATAVEMYCDRLPPGKCCRDRAFVFFRRDDDPRGHLLYIRTGKRSEKYLVNEAYPNDPDGRGWRLGKVSDGAVYTVYLHRNGQDASCCCAAAAYHTGTCKHVLTVRAVLAAGGFDPEDPADSPLFWDVSPEPTTDPFA